MSSALKPVLPPSGGQSNPANAPPAKQLPPSNMSHNTPTSYAQPMSHVPQNLSGLQHPHANMGMPLPVSHSINMPANIPPSMAGHPVINQGASLNIPGTHVSPNKSAVLPPAARANMMPYMLPREEEGMTLPPSQNAAQIMAAHRAQEQQFVAKPQSNGTPTSPEICNKTPVVPTLPAAPPAEAKVTEPPTIAVQNHVPMVHEAAKQPEASPEKVVNTVVTPSVAQDLSATDSKANSSLPVVPVVSAAPAQVNVAPEPVTEVAQAASSPAKAVVPKEAPKAPAVLKLATTPRTVNRKRELKPSKPQSENPRAKESKSAKSPSPARAKSGQLSDDENRSKRTRTRTQPYQSPLPELALISKLSNATPNKANDERLIVFYKNEFLAVRNDEGGFYVCQAVQNVYKSSLRIKIRWLSQDKNEKIYIPDFYDCTDFDCILTNLNMERIEKGKYTLPKVELERTENILKRALAVESGASAPSLTEEHPDGLDLSLFRDESQLKKKRKAAKRKAAEPLSSSSDEQEKTKRSPDKAKARKTGRKRRLSKAAKKTRAETEKRVSGENNKKKQPARGDSGRAERAKRRGEASPSSTSTGSVKTSPVVDQKKARVLAKVAMKTAIPQSKSNKKGSKAPPAPPPKAVASSSRGAKLATRSHDAASSSTSAATRRGKKSKK